MLWFPSNAAVLTRFWACTRLKIAGIRNFLPTRASSFASIPFQYKIRSDKSQGDDCNHRQRRVTMPALVAISKPTQFAQAQVLKHSFTLTWRVGAVSCLIACRGLHVVRGQAHQLPNILRTSG
jgi:hypothetical protein